MRIHVSTYTDAYTCMHTALGVFSRIGPAYHYDRIVSRRTQSLNTTKQTRAQLCNAEHNTATQITTQHTRAVHSNKTHTPASSVVAQQSRAIQCVSKQRAAKNRKAMQPIAHQSKTHQQRGHRTVSTQAKSMQHVATQHAAKITQQSNSIHIVQNKGQALAANAQRSGSTSV